MPSLDLKNPGVQRTALGLILSGALLGVFFFTKLLPVTFPNQQEHIEAMKVDYEKKSTELARARATVADLPRFEAEYAALHQRWTAAAELLPADHQMPVLLRKITLAAQQTGVRFIVFRPSDAATKEHYIELAVQLSISGDYHQVGSFLAELANMRRIVTVADLRLAAAGDAGSTAAEFVASAYSLNPNAAAASRAAATDQTGGTDANPS